MNADDLFQLVCIAVGLATVAGIALAARGRVFAKPADAAAGPYRSGALTPTQVETPPQVRSVGVASVVFGIGTSFVLAPAGMLGASMDWDASDAFEQSMAHLLGSAAATGVLAGLALAIGGIRVARGRGLSAAPWIALGWGAHHALVSFYFFGYASHQHRDVATWIVGALLVLTLGAVPAFMLRWAAREMQKIVSEVSAPEKSG